MLVKHDSKLLLVTGLTYRIDLLSPSAKKLLGITMSEVNSRFTSMSAKGTVGETFRYHAEFAVPISTTRSQVLGKPPKSSCLEIVAHIVDLLDPDGSPGFVFPLSVTPWTGGVSYQST